MTRLDSLRVLFNSFFNREKPKAREMKRVFQLKRYLLWNDLTSEEKLSAKRLIFVPIVAYFLFAFINQYAFSLVFLIFLYLAYKKFEKGKLTK